MQLTRNHSPPRLISLVPMVDVLLIMLVFFMVTSTYLKLGMIPVVKSSDSSSIATVSASDYNARPLMIRLDPEGQLRIQGQITPVDALPKFLAERLSETPDLVALIWPSPSASTQSLVTLIDTLTAAHVSRVRILQIAPIR